MYVCVREGKNEKRGLDKREGSERRKQGKGRKGEDSVVDLMHAVGFLRHELQLFYMCRRV